MGTVSPILQIRKEKLREIKLARDHTVKKMLSWDAEPAHLIRETAHLTNYTFRNCLPKLQASPPVLCRVLAPTPRI